MRNLGKYWAPPPLYETNSLIYMTNVNTGYCIDIAGVGSSILPTPTIRGNP